MQYTIKRDRRRGDIQERRARRLGRRKLIKKICKALVMGKDKRNGMKEKYSVDKQEERRL